MANPELSLQIERLNQIIKQEIEKLPNAYFTKTWHLLSDKNGKAVNSLPDRQGEYKAVRYPDGIHLTVFGGEIVAKEVIEQLRQSIDFELK